MTTAIHGTASLAAALDLVPAGDRARVGELLECYYRFLAGEEMRALRPEDLLGIALTHRETAGRRGRGEVIIRAFTPTVEANGWASGNSVVQIVCDDMAFLVDSVGAELARLGRPARRLLHPQLEVTRDQDGVLLAVADPAGGPTESWIHVEIGLEHSPEALDEVVENLRQVLGDVAAAVRDWSAMTDRARDCAQRLRSAAASGADPSADHVAALIDWTVEGHFVFLGARDYRLEGQTLRRVEDSDLGVLRLSGEWLPHAMPASAASGLLTMTKSEAVSTVHRPVLMDAILVRDPVEEGLVHAFVGLLTATAYTWSVMQVPFLADKVRATMERLGYVKDSHLSKDLLAVLETYPRDELFQVDELTLAENAVAIMTARRHLQTRVFVRSAGTRISCLVYLPRDRYTTDLRRRMIAVLTEVYGTDKVDFTASLTDSPLAIVHFTLRAVTEAAIPAGELQERIAQLARGWDEEFADAMRAEMGDQRGDWLTTAWQGAFPDAYKEQVSPRVAVGDVAALSELPEGGMRINPYQPPFGPPHQRRMKLYCDREVTLSELLPMLSGLGVVVTDERPYQIGFHGRGLHIFDLGMLPESGGWGVEGDRLRERFGECFLAVWEKRAESDRLNSLVLTAGLSWRQVLVLRALTAYLRQAGSPFSLGYLNAACENNPAIAATLVALFEAKFDPDATDRGALVTALADRLRTDLDQVRSLDEDRILRWLLAVVEAATRTNFFTAHPGRARPGDDPAADGSVAIKLDPRRVPNLPSPLPQFEIWVYSPRVEGVHLRWSAVARGGLRWSDRREDFRTEVLGLVKAQIVKNAIIVPHGAKGGFFAKQLPDPRTRREEWLAEGQRAYRLFVSSLLDVTDNLVGGAVVPPDRVVGHDGDDTYLVVAADKGTATLSDVANQIAADYGYWLGDGFASGGSTGYDHKKMGITARGAWESVKRHFRELGRDCQEDDFTCIGIGDMSGDVFGNGMLLSRHLRLVAAFDHRHIFIDPDPDAGTSYDERQRLFALPRSSWADYDLSLISQGGGVFARTAKRVDITDQMRTALGLAPGVTALTPAELIQAVLRAPVDLFWNGGIGTYVKSSAEQHSDAGDRSNDAVRVDAAQLRCLVVGEGGNLGFTQRGRIEAARAGVRINTDAIDNSGGVDTSDREVNLKILLSSMIRAQDLTMKQRNELLESMTDEVASSVLRTNYEQNVLLGNALSLDGQMLAAHEHLMEDLERRGMLDRQLEFLPGPEQVTALRRSGSGLSSPEFAVLVAYSKLSLKQDLIASDLPEDPWFSRELVEYFPSAVRGFSAAIDAHPLRREIIVNRIANSVVNRGGITFVSGVVDEQGSTPDRVVKAFTVCRELFDLSGFVAQVEALDGAVDPRTQGLLYTTFRRLLDRSVRALLRKQPAIGDVGALVARYRDAVRDLAPQLPSMLAGSELQTYLGRVADLRRAGIGAELAGRAAGLLDEFSLLDVVDIAELVDEPAGEVGRVYFGVSDELGIDRLLTQLSGLPYEAHWDALARHALREDVYATLAGLTRSVLETTDKDLPTAERLAAWLALTPGIDRARSILGEAESVAGPSLAPLMVALRALRSV